jgi:hypothetical protein
MPPTTVVNQKTEKGEGGKYYCGGKLHASLIEIRENKMTINYDA